ncbi:MAG: ribose 5-phosphate isomerase B [Armatimonadota bacterium]
MKLALGGDHAITDIKDSLISELQSSGHEVLYFGSHNGEAIDYPDVAEQVAHSILNNDAKLGILVCGTGVGMSIAANKIPGIRCAHAQDPVTSALGRNHNDANMLAVGQRILGFELMIETIKAFIGTEFSNGERHKRRVSKIKAIQDKR